MMALTLNTLHQTVHLAAALPQKKAYGSMRLLLTHRLALGLLVVVVHVLGLLWIAMHRPVETPKDITPPVVLQMVLPSVMPEKQPEVVPTPAPKKEVNPIKKVVEPKIKPVQKPLETTQENIIASPDTPQATSAVQVSTAPPEPQPAPQAESQKNTTAAEKPAVIPPNFDANYLNNPAPRYPALSKKLGEQGQVLLRVYIETTGLPSVVEIKKSSGFERLDNTAIETVKLWKFVPAKQGDNHIAAWVIVPIQFNIKKGL